MIQFSRWGEIVNLNLLRDKKTGKSKGFAFICYEDQRSTVLAVDNFNGITLAGRQIRVDHVKDYKPPKEHENDDDLIRTLKEMGCAPGVQLPEPSRSPPRSASKYNRDDKYSKGDKYSKDTKQDSKRFKR